METSLHQQIKRMVARDADSIEVNCGPYRIDAIDPQGRFVEVQYGPLAALRGKVLELRSDYSLRIIKPIAVEKQIVTIHPKTREVLRSRRSPKHEQPIEVFQELIHFTQCFPHPNLQVEFWMVQVVETRIDRPQTRRRRKKFQPVDVELKKLTHKFSIQSLQDLVALLKLPQNFMNPFCTKALSEAIERPRWFAQQVAYVLHRCGAASRVGKQGNSHVYEWSENVSTNASASCENVLNNGTVTHRRRRNAA